nr:ABC transporter ATP-binding protein [Comamonas jiangduensis]
MLEVRNIEAGYGASQVLFGVSLTIEPHQVVSLMGRNGMGKSTTIKCITGALPLRKGQIFFEGQEITNLPADEIARRGIALVPEGRMCFPNLTVREHLVAFARKADAKQDAAWDLQRIYELFPRLKEREHNMGNQLSGGEQQMLTLCRTLMGDPDLIIIDEPTEGLAPKIVELVGEYLKKIKERGVSVLLIEQKLTIAMRISDRALVMGHGAIVFDGTPQSLNANTNVRKEWLEV